MCPIHQTLAPSVAANSEQDFTGLLLGTENPHNWGKYKKLVIVLTGLLAVMNSTIASSLPSNAGTSLSMSFPQANQVQLVLPVSIFLVGYVLGPMIWGPLSEVQGRKPILTGSFLLYTIFMMACALAPNFPLLLVFRLLCGANAAAPVVVVGGVYADVFPDPRQRGKAIALLMAVTNIGPCLGPVITGNVSHVSWRWSYWVGLLLAGITIPFMLWLPETFAPVLQQRKRREERKSAVWRESARNSQTKELRLDASALTRPFQMIMHESIVLFTCIYLSFAYGIFYLYFQAYPIIFQGAGSIYKLTPEFAGLAFLPIGIGAIGAGCVYLLWDAYLTKSTQRGKEWTRNEEMRRLIPACAGGPLFVSALFWLGWTCRSDIHWIVPALSGLLFGAGFVLIFIAMLNYLTDAYMIYAASAQGIASTCRSVFGALLPLAGKHMYTALGVNWASSLLGFVGVALALVPFGFIRYGKEIRARSRFSARKVTERVEREV